MTDKLSRNFFFALLISLAIMAVIMLLGAICAGTWYLITEAYHIFPYHTIFAVIIFWLWFAHKLMAEVRDDDL